MDSSPDETRTFEKGKIDVANLGDITIGRAIFEPGWSWEKCVKPIAKTTRLLLKLTTMAMEIPTLKGYFDSIVEVKDARLRDQCTMECEFCVALGV